MVHERRRGTALVETPDGILVVSEGARWYSLPGGGAGPDESGEHAAARELREETCLKRSKSSFLFEHRGTIRRSHHGGYYRDIHEVFLIKTEGVAKPRGEVHRLAYFDGSRPALLRDAREIIERYRRDWNRKPS